MTHEPREHYYGKIMLFGEYGIIHHGMSLNIPDTRYSGKFRWIAADLRQEREENLHQQLRLFFEYLQKLDGKRQLIVPLDLAALQDDLAAGMIFDSDLPQGYGLGSSGSLCAAIYDRYALFPLLPTAENLKNQGRALRKQLGQLETFFHGTSSGIDPLICYVNEAILVDADNRIRIVAIPKGEGERPLSVFRLNTHKARETLPLVQLFLERCRVPEYFEMVQERLIPTSNACIEAFLGRDFDAFELNSLALSELTFQHFLPMIPQAYQGIWKRGLEDRHYTLKLCGAGGGGFLLGFTRDRDKTESLLKDYSLDWIVDI